MTAALIWSTFGDMQSAEAVAGTLLEERLIACANILPTVRSLYRWNGERGDGSEVAVLLKTRADLLDATVTRLEALHPYDAPAISGWRCDEAGAATLGWLERDCGAQ